MAVRIPQQMMEGGAPRRRDRSVRLAGARPSTTYAQRCADFGRQSLHPSCWMKITRHTFAAQKFAEKSSMNAVRIFFLEIGGTKNRGRAPSGICRSDSGELVRVHESDGTWKMDGIYD